MRRCLLLAVPLLLAACASPQDRVREGLIDAGVPPTIAACMAPRMAERLSLLQLRRLSKLGGVRDVAPTRAGIEAYIQRSGIMDDPEILGVVTTAAAICALQNR